MSDALFPDSSSSRSYQANHKLVARPNKMWVDLPQEIRRMILETIANEKYPGWASCAAVSREWQATIACRNLHHITLRPVFNAELLEMEMNRQTRATLLFHDFKETLVLQRHLVRHIVLDLELPEYDCSTCDLPEDLEEESSASFYVWASLMELFRILESWEPTNGLIFELNVFSPSDYQHWFPNHILNTRSTRLESNDAEPSFVHSPVHSHGWQHGRRVMDPPPMAILRLFRFLCYQQHRFDDFPKVEVITGLVIRRQTRYSISSFGCLVLAKSLPRLESIAVEPWENVIPGVEAFHDAYRAGELMRLLPKSVRTLSVFENTDKQLMAALQRSLHYVRYVNKINNGGPAPKKSTPLIAHLFNSKSTDYECLSLSFVVDAQGFFNARPPLRTWRRLRFLHLTGSILTRAKYQRDKEQIFRFLEDAAKTAQHMPELERMVLWNSQDHEACSFRYHLNKEVGLAVLTWRGTWEIEFSQGVVEHWERVALDRYLSIHVEVERARVRNLADAITYLRLPDGIVDPRSLWQMDKEDVWSRIGDDLGEDLEAGMEKQMGEDTMEIHG